MSYHYPNLKETLPTVTTVLGISQKTVKYFLLVPIRIKYGLRILFFFPHCTNQIENKEISKLLVFIDPGMPAFVVGPNIVWFGLK